MFSNAEVAIITGAAQGIGKVIAEAFAREGVRTVLLDVNQEQGALAAQEINKQGAPSHFIPCDVSNVEQIQKAVDETISKYQRIDILVNNAGILHSTPIEEITESEWDRMMAINLKSVFFTAQKVLPYFKKQGGGKIVNISSLAGRNGGIANGLGYSASKAGIIGLTYGLARRLALHNVNVNAVAPGTTQTDILKEFSAEKVRELERSVPLMRLGKPEDIANTVVFLSSSKANFITGAVLDVNGGMFMG